MHNSVDLAAGQIKVGFVGTTGVIDHVRAGRLKGLAVSSAERRAVAPEIPTIAEAGYDFQRETYFVLLAPAATPEPSAETKARLQADARLWVKVIEATGKRVD